MEIGSVLEFEDWDAYQVPQQKEKPIVFPFMEHRKYQIVFYQNGRNAIESLLLFLKQKKGITKVWMPDFICETVPDAAKRAGFTVLNYPVNRDYDASFEQIKTGETIDFCIYVNHLFGKRIQSSFLNQIKEWKRQGILVIEDVTMSLLSSDENGMGFGNYVIGSARKWFPIPDGGFIASESDGLPLAPDKNIISKYSALYSLVQIMKKDYVNGGETNDALKTNFREYYALAIHELFSDYEIYPISPISYYYLQQADFHAIAKKRAENYDYLYQRLKDLGFLPKVAREEKYLPFGMVISTEHRDELLRHLIENKIYCNIHWKLSDPGQTKDVKFLANSSMTIPCDQRYNTKDMEWIATVLERSLKN